MNGGYTAGFLALMLVVIVTMVFLWKIWYITFPHWKWRKDHFGRNIRAKLTNEEWSKVKRYRLYFFLGMVTAIVLFVVISYLNGGPV